MNDPFLQDLKPDWQSQEADVAKIARRLRRARFAPHLLLLMEAIGGLAGLGGGILLLAEAIRTGDTLFMIAAPVLLIGAPLLAITAFRARRGSLRWEDETPESILRTALARAEAAERAIGVAHFSAYTLFGFACALWAALAIGIVGHATFVLWYGALLIGSAVATWGWLKFRERKVKREIAACTKALAEFRLGSD